MRYSKVCNCKADICDACNKDTGYAGVRYISQDGSNLYCEPCFLAKQKADRKAAAASKAAVKAMLAADLAKMQEIMPGVAERAHAALVTAWQS